MRREEVAPLTFSSLPRHQGVNQVHFFFFHDETKATFSHWLFLKNVTP